MTAIPAPVRRRLISKLRPKVVAAATALTTVLLCCTGGLALVLLSGLPGDERRFQLAMNCGAGGIVDISGQMPFVPGYGDNQLRNAAIIIRTGAELEVAPRGWVIAVATAMQESTLVNLGHLGQINDHDSLGLFQQRPSQGWGTPAQLQDPVYSSTKFYREAAHHPRLGDAAADRGRAGCADQRLSRRVRQARDDGRVDRQHPGQRRRSGDRRG